MTESKEMEIYKDIHYNEYTKDRYKVSTQGTVINKKNKSNFNSIYSIRLSDGIASNWKWKSTTFSSTQISCVSFPAKSM